MIDTSKVNTDEFSFFYYEPFTYKKPEPAYVPPQRRQPPVYQPLNRQYVLYHPINRPPPLYVVAYQAPVFYTNSPPPGYGMPLSYTPSMTSINNSPLNSPRSDLSGEASPYSPRSEMNSPR